MNEIKPTTNDIHPSHNPINQLINLKKFARMWNVDFKFTSKEAAFHLPEKCAPFIRDQFEIELFHMGYPEFERSEDKLSYSVTL